jgi:glycosyltransferase involved in cell wall biosynthesis
MRIAIDVTSMPREKVGAGYYMQNLVKGLAEIPSANRYLVFAPRDDVASFGVANTGFSFDSFGIDSRIGRLLWEQTVLPIRLRQHRADLLHSTHYTIPILGGARRIVTFHDMTFFLYPEMHTSYKRFFFRMMISISSRRANAIIADSESTRQDILRLLKLDPAKVYAVPLGVSPQFRPIHDRAEIESIRRKYHLPEQLILHVGVLEPRKNMSRLVQTFKQIVSRGFPHHLVFVGRKGWMYGELFQTIRELGIADRVIFTGYVPGEELPLLFNAADLSVYPSLYEGFGLPVLEAMACGVPVVTSNISSMPEIAGDAGILVNPRDVNELADAMCRVLTDRALHDELAHKGRARSKLFTWERTARETLAVYERVARPKSNIPHA